MGKKFAVILLSAALGAAMLNGCGRTDKGHDKKTSHEWEDKDAVYGEVERVTKDTVTIKVGTRKEMERPQERDVEKLEESKEKEKPSMLELTGEEQELVVTQETTIKRRSMGGLPEDGENQPDGEMPQKPDGEAGEMPQKPDGEAGEMPQKPDGEAGGMPQKPEAGQNSGEEITLSDISEGDIIMVTFTDEKKAAEITVLSVSEGNGREADSTFGGQDNGSGMV